MSSLFTGRNGNSLETLFFLNDVSCQIQFDSGGSKLAAPIPACHERPLSGDRRIAATHEQLSITRSSRHCVLTVSAAATR